MPSGSESIETLHDNGRIVRIREKLHEDKKHLFADKEEEPIVTANLSEAARAYLKELGIGLSGEQDVGAENRCRMARGAGRMPSGRAGGTPATRCRRARRGKISYGVWRIAWCVWQAIFG